MHSDVIIIGAGAAGLMCAISAGKRSRNVVILEHADKIGQKILVSGGGRCNFSNLNIGSENYISKEPDFARSALARFDHQVLFSLFNKHNIAYYEKCDGQLFCKQPSKAFLSALRKECEMSKVRFIKGVKIKSVSKETLFIVDAGEKYTADSLVVATGGLSYKKLGASDLGHRIARQFGHSVVECRPGLVPLIFNDADRRKFDGLSGISFEAKVSCGKVSFAGGVLLTHKGISGPAILQISSYWERGKTVTIDIANATQLPKRLEARLKDVGQWTFVPKGTEGYDKAEVTVGGVDVRELSSRTMGSSIMDGLYFIGEVMDMTGQLGGYNLHWAWASGQAAGSCV